MPAETVHTGLAAGTTLLLAISARECDSHVVHSTPPPSPTCGAWGDPIALNTTSIGPPALCKQPEMAALLRVALCLALLAAPVALAGCPFAGLVGSDARRELMATGGSAPAPCDVALLNSRNERTMLRSIPWQTQTAHAVKRVRGEVCSLAAGAPPRVPASTAAAAAGERRLASCINADSNTRPPGRPTDMTRNHLLIVLCRSPGMSFSTAIARRGCRACPPSPAPSPLPWFVRHSMTRAPGTSECCPAPSKAERLAPSSSVLVPEWPATYNACMYGCTCAPPPPHAATPLTPNVLPAPSLMPLRTTKKGGPNGSLRFEITQLANSDSRMVLASAYIDKYTAVINARLANMAAARPRVRPRVGVGRQPACNLSLHAGWQAGLLFGSVRTAARLALAAQPNHRPPPACAARRPPHPQGHHNLRG